MQKPRSFHETVAGVDLHWSERGRGSVVVVLHGLSDSERSWWPVMAELGRHHHVFGLDLPGCGQSARPDASYRLDWQARILAAWLDRVGITTCDVVGHSYGGGLAMWLLLYRASAVRRLALVAPGGLGSEVAFELRLASLPFVVESLGQPWMGSITWLLLALNGHALSSEAREALYRLNARPGTARAFARTVRDVIDYRGQTRHFWQRAREAASLPSIALFWGEDDRIIPISQGEALVERLEHCTLQRFPKAGHFLHWERPHELASALLKFLADPSVQRARLKDSVKDSLEPDPASQSSALRTLPADRP